MPSVQGVRRRAAEIEPAPCAAYIHAYLLQAMDSLIALWQSRLDGDPQIVTNYIADEYVASNKEFESGFLALQNGFDLALFPTPTLIPIAVGPDNILITLPIILTILPSANRADVEVRDRAGGNRLTCRLEGGLKADVVEVSRDRKYLRVENTECDGWISKNNVIP